MARPRTLPDTEILAAVRQLLAAGGDKAVSFGTVGRAVQLAPSTLAQRFGSVAGMRAAAVRDGWQALTEQTLSAIDGASDKGPVGLLKALDPLAGVAAGLLAASADAADRQAAADWRLTVETAIAGRIAPAGKPRETAAMLFAAWQGQALWGAEGFRMKEVFKRLG
ncbi:transcriptional regulator [Rhodobacter sp.]